MSTSSVWINLFLVFLIYLFPHESIYSRHYCYLGESIPKYRIVMGNATSHVAIFSIFSPPQVAFHVLASVRIDILPNQFYQDLDPWRPLCCTHIPVVSLCLIQFVVFPPR